MGLDEQEAVLKLQPDMTQGVLLKVLDFATLVFWRSSGPITV
jgi:hypothetical protein